ncbi:MAG: hypothetical protein ACR2PX_28695 [Endozoicomonas sp.]|uniref:hypothetical protein n=1 Tax=Endozoicomonas sp. TaxID=1892382 RepID=UPI003D9BEDE5
MEQLQPQPFCHFQWNLEGRVQGSGSIDTNTVGVLRGIGPDSHFTEGTQALLVIVMALLIILDPDLPDSSQFSEDGLSGFINATQLNQLNPGWLNISSPAALEGVSWPSIDIFLPVISEQTSSIQLRMT